jgi:hypothetical protein
MYLESRERGMVSLMPPPTSFFYHEQYLSHQYLRVVEVGLSSTVEYQSGGIVEIEAIAACQLHTQIK